MYTQAFVRSSSHYLCGLVYSDSTDWFSLNKEVYSDQDWSCFNDLERLFFFVVPKMPQSQDTYCSREQLHSLYFILDQDLSVFLIY